MGEARQKHDFGNSNKPGSCHPGGGWTRSDSLWEVSFFQHTMTDSPSGWQFLKVGLNWPSLIIHIYGGILKRVRKTQRKKKKKKAYILDGSFSKIDFIQTILEVRFFDFTPRFFLKKVF